MSKVRINRKIDREVREALRDAGAELVRLGRHFIFRLPNGRTVTVSGTPGDHRATQNTLRDIEAARRLPAGDVREV